MAVEALAPKPLPRRKPVLWEGRDMNYCFNWLIVYAYRNWLIDRKEFMSPWGAVQGLSEERKERCLTN